MYINGTTGSCDCTTDIHRRVSISTLKYFSSIHIWSIIDLQLLDSQQLIHVHRHSITCLQKLVQSRPTLDQDVNHVSIKCSQRCWLSINWVLTESQSREWITGIDQHSTVDAFSTVFLKWFKLSTSFLH